MSLPATSWLSAGLVFVTVVLGSVGLALLLEAVQEGRRRRQVVQQLKTLGALDAVEAATSGGLLRRPIEQQPAWLQALSARWRGSGARRPQISMSTMRRIQM